MATRDVAVIGAGRVGTALADGLRRVGHRVAVAVRDVDDAKYDETRATHRLVPTTGAAQDVEIVILAVPVPALAEVVPALGLGPGTVVVDATNAVGTPVPGGFDTVAAYVGSLVPDGVPVVKAFNTVGAEHLGDGRGAFLTVAGDDDGRAVAVELAEDLGFEVADLGGPDTVGLAEDHARLWIHLALRRGWGRDFAFGVVRR